MNCKNRYIIDVSLLLFVGIQAYAAWQLSIVMGVIVIIALLPVVSLIREVNWCGLVTLKDLTLIDVANHKLQSNSSKNLLTIEKLYYVDKEESLKEIQKMCETQWGKMHGVCYLVSSDKTIEVDAPKNKPLLIPKNKVEFVDNKTFLSKLEKALKTGYRKIYIDLPSEQVCTFDAMLRRTIRKVSSGLSENIQITYSVIKTEEIPTPNENVTEQVTDLEFLMEE